MTFFCLTLLILTLCSWLPDCRVLIDISETPILNSIGPQSSLKDQTKNLLVVKKECRQWVLYAVELK
jgi:hypothetical protein